MTIPPQRELFDIPREICYLNAAYMTPFPRRFEEIGRRALSGRLHPWETAPADFFERSERVRALAARVFDASAGDMALVPAVSYAVATAARNLAIGEGDVILTLDEEFPSNYYGWARLAAERGATLEIVPGPPERDWTAAVLEAIAAHGDRVALVAAPHVHWSTGAMLDLAGLRRATRAAGAALFLDLTQSLGALPASMREIAPDYAVAAGYKWLFGPYSLGFFYIAPERQSGCPLEENWIARAGSENFRALVDYQDDYQPAARRYDMGERSNFLLMPLAEAALELVLDWGIEDIAETLRALTDRLAAALEAHGFACTPRDRRAPHLMAARHPGIAADALSARWREFGIVASARGNWVRIAPHLWIDSADEALFRESLEAIDIV